MRHSVDLEHFAYQSFHEEAYIAGVAEAERDFAGMWHVAVFEGIAERRAARLGIRLDRTSL